MSSYKFDECVLEDWEGHNIRRILTGSYELLFHM
jgi:hypothetical protein